MRRLASGAREFVGIGAALISNARACIFDSLDLQSFGSELASGNRIRCIRVDCGGVWLSSNVAMTCGHRDVDVFKNLTRCDAQYSVERLDEIVTSATAVLAAEVVDEGEAGAELFGFDEESCAVGFPFCGFHGALIRALCER